MSVDLQVVFPQEQIQLNSVRLVPGSRYLLDVIGVDFISAQSVTINNVDAPSFVVLNRTRLLAKVPASVENEIINDVQVLARQLALTRKSLMKFTLSKSPQMVTGLLKLVQSFLILLLNTQGSDKFEKGRGASALRAIGESYGADQSNSIVGDFVTSVGTAQRQMIAIQSKSTTIPREERLLGAKVVQARFSRELSSLIVSVEVTSLAGRAAVANLET